MITLRILLPHKFCSLEPPGLRGLLLLLRVRGVMVGENTRVASNGRLHAGWGALLDLKEQRRVLDLDQGIHVLQASLHEGNLWLHRVVSEGDGLSDYFLTARHEVCREQFDELVLDVLNKVEFGSSIPAHYEDSEEAMRLLDARVDHLDKDIGVLVEVDHQLLCFLHLTEAIFFNQVGVVEEEVILWGQLQFYILDVIVVVRLFQQIKNDWRCLTRTKIFTLIASRVPTSYGPLLGSWILSSNGASLSYKRWCPSAAPGLLKWKLTKSGVHFINGCEIEGVKHWVLLLREVGRVLIGCSCPEP